MNVLIKNGRVIDPAGGTDAVADILVSSGRIEKVGPSLSAKADTVIDAAGKIVTAGLVDMHAHLREPGREDKETVASGTRAAVKGGFSAVACMPNTDPAIDGVATMKRLGEIVSRDAVARVHIIAAITKGRLGKEVCDMDALRKAGAVAFSDDGSTVADEKLLMEAMNLAAREQTLVIEHCEDAKGSAGGVINLGLISTKMGLRGISRESEYSVVARDIAVAARTGARLHVAHASTRETVALLRKAKRDGVRVTAETCPHYLALTDACCQTFDTNMKMNPPLRTASDVEALREGLADGTIDVIATDHAPHTDSEKDVEFDVAPFGIIGLETALSVSAMELVDRKVLTWAGLLKKLSANPATILGAGGGTLAPGSAADIAVIDPDREYVYARESVVSKSKNSPFLGWNLKVAVTDLLVGGKPVLRDGAFV